MRRKTILLTALALALVLSSSLGSAWSYFTTYAQAVGGHPLTLGDRTQVEEDFYDWTKHVTIRNEEESEPVYVRAKAFGGSKYPLVYSGEGWTPGADGYYYYNTMLNGGEATSELLVQISGVPKEEVEEGASFNVVVIYESAPVLYDEAGDPLPVTAPEVWAQKIEEGTWEGGVEG